MAEIRSLRDVSSPVEKTEESPQQPCNIEAEQALLGAILSNNDVLSTITSIIDENHFFDPVHRKIFQLCKERISQDRFASPVTMKAFIGEISGLSDLGGVDYLYKLADSAISIHACNDYAQEIFDLSARRAMIAIGENLSFRARKADIETSVSDLIEETEQNLFEISETGTRSIGFQSSLKGATEVVEIVKRASDSYDGLSGLSTGFIDLDKKLGGLQASDLIIIAGRPSMGKTALATNIAYNVAKNFDAYGRSKDKGSTVGGYVGFFSLEMSLTQLSTRILAEKTGIPSSQIRRGLRSGQPAFDDWERLVEAANEYGKLPLFTDDTSSLTIAQLASRARRQKQTNGLDLLIVDYLQMVSPTSKRSSVVHEVAEVSRGLKAIAKNLNIPVIAVSQLSRQVEQRDDKRPQLSDLRESGSIEQDADVVMFVYREAYYEGRKKPDESDQIKMMEWTNKMEEISRKAEVIIGKQRNGPIGTVELTFNANLTQFGNAARKGDTEYDGNPSDFADDYD